MIEKYHVYILGAGASFHAGIPLLTNFFQTAEALCEGNKARQAACNGYQNSIERIRQFRRDNSKNCQVQNVEDVYRLALESNNCEVLDALENVILGVLDLNGCLVYYDGNKYKPNKIYDSFINKIFPYDEAIWARQKTINSTVIITFNWDCLIDYAMFYRNITPYYGIGQFCEPDTPKLFKMHGSINWEFCRKCNSLIKPIRPQDFVGHRSIMKPIEFDLRIVSEGLGRKKCSCGGALSPKIIPPIPQKNLPDEVKCLWDEAKDILSKAYRISLIGYSFPQTDLDFLYLVRDAMENNIDLMEIDVINPSSSDTKFQNNYKNNFRDHSHKIYFNKIKSFEEYVASI